MATNHADTMELRVLHGPQAGSRLPLAKNQEYLLGASSECAVILSGQGIAEEHALIHFVDGQPRIAAMQSPVCDARGNPVTEEEVLAAGMPLVLGAVWIAIDHVASAWPATQAIAQAIVPGGERQEAGAAAGQAVAQTAPAAPKARVRQHVKSSSFSLKKVAAALGLLVASSSGLAAWFYNAPIHENAVEAEVAAPTPPRALTAALTALGLSSAVTVSPNGIGGWVLGGYVPTHAKENALAAALENITPAPHVNVIVEEDLVGAANALLGRQAVPGEQLLHVENAGQGKLRLLGAAANAAIVRAAEKALPAQVPGVRGVESDVALPAKLLELFKSKMAAEGFSGRLSIVREEPVVVLKGDLTNEEIARWEKFFVRFCAEDGNVLPIDANVGGQTRAFALNVQTIVGGPVPYVVTSGGERVNLGGTIRGRTIVAIRDGSVTFDGNVQLKNEGSP